MFQKMCALLEQLRLPVPDYPLFSRDLWLQAWVYPPALVRNPAGLSGREGGGRMRLSLLDNPAGLHLLLRASWKSWELEKELTPSVSAPTSVSCVSDNSAGLLCGLWQRSGHWCGIFWQPAVSYLESSILLWFPGLSWPQKNAVKKGQISG